MTNESESSIQFNPGLMKVAKLPKIMVSCNDSLESIEVENEGQLKLKKQVKFLKSDPRESIINRKVETKHKMRNKIAR